MRLDRDMLRSDLGDMKKNTALINVIREDTAKISQRLCNLEMKWIQVEDWMRDAKRGNLSGTLHAIQERHEAHVKESETLRNMYAENMDRINRLDLSVSKLTGKTATM